MLFSKKKNDNKQNISNRIKENLLEINFGDPAIYTNGKASLFLDLKPFVDDKTLLNFLWGKEEKLVLAENDLQDQAVKQLENVSQIEDVFMICELYGIVIDPKVSNKWKNVKDAIEGASTSIKKTKIKVVSVVNKLARTVRQIERDQSIYSFYIGSYFLQGIVDNEDKALNAPLLLWEVTVNTSSGKVEITKNDDHPTINEKVNFYIKQKTKSDIQFNQYATVKEILEYKLKLRTIGMVEFDETNLAPFSKPEDGTIKIQNSCGLMIVAPTGGVISYDIMQMQKDKADPFKINTQTQKKDVYKEKVISKDNIIEINRKLNIYQKYAIESALNENTLIYGPPGTGKSETIASLIANILNEEGTILVSSEKQDALEVIDKRLGVLNAIALTGYNRDINAFYEKLDKFEVLIRKAIDKPKLKNRNDAYEKLVDANELFNDFFNPKAFDKKQQKSFKDFAHCVEQVDGDKILELMKLGIFNYFNEIMKKQELNYEQAIAFIREFQHKVQPYKQQLDVLLGHATFDAYDKNDLSKFLSNYEGAPDAELLLSNLIMKNKASGKTIFKTKALLVNQDHEAFAALFHIFVDMKFNNLSKEVIELMCSFNYDVEEFRQMLDYNWWVDNLSSEKVFNKPTMNELRIAYINERDAAIKNNAQQLLDTYIINVSRKIDKLKDEQKQKLFSIFSKTKLKKKPSINLFIKEFYNELRILFPIWMLTPEQVCITCPIDKEAFDYGIFDEASQMFVEKSYPLVYRCKTKVVAGDDKQLQPNNFFAMRSSIEEENILTEDASESLFEAADACLWSKFYLKNHYRSINGELIAFSNKYFYENELQYANYNGYNACPISIYDVKGKWENNCNTVEIDKVMEILKANEAQFVNKSIIVVTFNLIQCNKMESTFVNQFSGTKLLNRYKDKHIIFKSLENVQGTEADVVILSMSYGPNETGTIRQFFGPLSQNNGINRLNVAITRAKEQMIVVKSMKHEDIKLSENKNNNIFKDYLGYLDNISNKQDNKLVDIQPKLIPAGFVNFMETQIKQKGCSVLTNYVIGNKVIDVAIVNDANGKVVFGIILNENKDRTDTMELMELIDSTQFLTDLGYNIYFLNTIDWYVRKEIIQKEIYNKFLSITIK